MRASRRRWSAVALKRGSFYLGAPGRVPIGALGEVADQRQADGRRVLAVARSAAPLPSEPHDEPPEDLEPVGLVVLAEELRPGVSDTVEFLQEEGVEIKVLSGDGPATVAAIARDVGIPVAGARRVRDPGPGGTAGVRGERQRGRAHLPRGQAGDRPVPA